ncbi:MULTISPECIES: DUF58 domain-containing protein [unclassified Adlercreutzia]|uniref:DUF58 domain-containing protein n=1 Tax=unclassified Adlercreutzia TaxID=2636013 RepID=UPI0013EADE7F|nr:MULTISPECIES: DUF58 domain-containing protein [unclassified Adlercreutzia]
MLKNRVASVLVIVLAAMIHFWADSSLSLAFLLASVAVPVVLLAQLRLAASFTHVAVDVEPSYQIGEERAVSLRLERGLPLCLAVVSLRVRVANCVFDTEEEHEVEAAVSTRHSTCSLSVLPDRYGRMLVEARDARLTDPLGLFVAHLPLDLSCESVMRPMRVRTEVLLSQTPQAHVFGDSFDNTKSGHDVGEVFDVREYVPGDSLASIHWKLSTKFDALIARQFSRPADYDVALVACGCREASDETCNGVASVALSLSEALLRAGVFHDAGFLHEQQVSCHLVDDVATHAAFSDGLLSTPLSPSAREVSQVLAGETLSERFTKVILVTCFYDEATWADLAQTVDLTVVVVTDDELAGSASSVSERYGLFTLRAKGVADHEHRITL